MTSPDTPSLLPCPFCGASGDAVHGTRDDHGSPEICCDGCGAFVPVETWNRRPAPSDDEVERVAMALENLMADQHSLSQLNKLARAAIAAMDRRSERAAVIEASPDDLRAAGLSVAVHNDYSLDRKRFTFWLMTRKTDRGLQAFKGEGQTDAEALNQIRALAVKP